MNMNRGLIGIVIGLLGSSCWAADELVINQPLLVDIDNVNTNHYGGSFAILGLRVMEGVNTLASGYASRAGGEGAMAEPQPKVWKPASSIAQAIRWYVREPPKASK